MKNVLYVEDNADTANAVKIILSDIGCIVETAPNGQEGVKLAKSKDYDLILLDIMLPDMTGLDIYSQIKSGLKSKIAFLSAIPVSSDRMEQLRLAGVSDYITKPFAKADLIQRITKILD